MKNWIITFTLLLSCKFLAAQTVLVPYNGTLYWVGRATVNLATPSGVTLGYPGNTTTLANISAIKKSSWYNPNNWATTSGGTMGGINYVPGPDTHVIFDGGGGATQNAIVGDFLTSSGSASSITNNMCGGSSAKACILSLTTTASYTGTISFSTGWDLTIYNDVTQTLGKIDLNGGSLTCNDDLILTGDVAISITNNATLTVPNNKIYKIVGSLTIDNGNLNMGSGTSAIHCDGCVLSTNRPLDRLIISQDFQLNNNLTINKHLCIASGVTDLNGYDINVGAGATLDSDITFSNGAIDASSVIPNPITPSTTQLLINNGSIRIKKGNIYLRNGNTENNSVSHSGNIVIEGTGDQTIENTLGSSSTPQGSVPNIVINKSAGKLYLRGILQVRGNWTHLSGEVDATTHSSSLFIRNQGVCEFTSSNKDLMALNNLDIFRGQLNVNVPIVIKGNLNIRQNATYNCTATEDLMHVRGNITIQNSATAPNLPASFTFPNQSGGYLVLDGVTQSITFNNAAGGTIPRLRIGSTSTTTIASDLEVSNLLEVENGGTLNLSNRMLHVKGNTNNSGTINSSLATIQFTGTDLQQWTNSNGTEQTIGNVIMNNSNGLQLNSPIRINANLNLQNGKIFTSSANLLTLNDNATITGFSNSSYVVGPLKKVGDDFVSTFTFPVGSAVRYKPVTLSDAINNTISDEFTVTYFQATPPSSTNLDTDEINGINNQEYWDIHRSVGATTALKIQLPWSAVEGTSWASNAITIVHFNGTEWEQPSTTSVTGISGSGTVTTNNRVSSFSEWSTGEDIIVMPVSFIDFDGNVSVVNQYDLSWSTATELNNEKFILEKSSDGQHYEKIAEVLGSGNSRSRNDYHFTYSSEKHYSNLYFRLLQQDYDGKQEFLKLIQVHNLNEKQLVYPNLLQANMPTKLNFILNENQESFSEIVYAIYDISGKVISRDVLGASKAIDVCLTFGTYVLKISTKGGLITSKLFVH